VRPLAIESFDVRDGRVVAVDEVIPLAVEADLTTGRMVGTWTWDLSTEFRDRRTATAVALTRAEIVVASPAAGGLVRIDRATGATTLVPLAMDAGQLRRDGETVWAAARNDDDENDFGDAPPRPVVWEGGPQDDDDHDMEGDPTAVILPPTPVWRVDGTTVTAYDFGGQVEDFVVLDGAVVAVCTLPTDPLIKLAGGDWIGFARPATLLRGDPERGLAKVTTVPDGSGVLVVDGRVVWLVGFDRDDEPATVGRLGPQDAEPVPVQRVGRREPDPLTVVGGRIISLDGDRRGAQARIMRLDRRLGRRVVMVDLPPLAEDTAAEGTVVWFRHRTRPTLVGLDVERATVTEVVLDIDTAQFVAPAERPPGLDLDRYETEQRDGLRAAFFGGWEAEDGTRRPYIAGVTFESVELRGSFPETVVVALFRSEDRPGIRFGRRWSLYDELGNPEDESLEYADIGLMEDVEAGGYGLPEPAACVPDAEGIVWFDAGWHDDRAWP
jgi:hypothetical protein